MLESRRARMRNALHWLAPSVAFAAVASLLCGVAEAASVTPASALEFFAAAALVVIVFFPAAVALAVVARLLWRAWRPAVIATVEEGGGAPVLAAWIVYAGMAAGLLAFAAASAVEMVHGRTSKPAVFAFGVSVVVVTTVGLLLLASRPIVVALAGGLRAIDRRIRVRFARSPLRPRWIAVGTALAVVIAALVIWPLAIRPRIGEFDAAGVFARPVLLVTLLAALHALQPLLAQRGRAVRCAGAGAIALAIALCIVPFWLEAARPRALLDIWWRYPTSGEIVDRFWDADQWTPRARAPLAERPGARHPSIVLVTIDTMRADETPPYRGASAMPALKNLGQRGVTFEWAIAPSNVTRRAIPAIATGVTPRRIRGRKEGSALKLDPRHSTFIQRLDDAGYHTAGFFSDRTLGIEKGFDFIDFSENDSDLGKLAAAWINQRRSAKPFFVWVHLMAPSRWSDQFTAKKYGADVRGRYRLGLNASDRGLKQILDAAGNEILVIVASDHGEGLGDHGAENHGRTLYLSETRVPLIFAGPGLASRRISQAVSLVDLAPTILDLAGFVPPGMPEMDGESLAPLIRVETRPNPDASWAVSSSLEDNEQKRDFDAVVSGRHHLIAGPRLELYDYLADPKEEHDLAAERPEVVAEILKKLEAKRLAGAQPPF